MNNTDRNIKTEASELDSWLFASGNFGSNLVFIMISTYIMYFYTNVLGVSAAAAGTIFMVARLVDAVTDPIMGMIVDRTNSKRFGKYRGYITIGAPFLGIAFVALFTAPQLSAGGRLFYAYFTYILYSLIWTVVQIPKAALPIMLSNNSSTRTRINAIVQALGSIATMVITSWVLPMLDVFGGQDNPAAWQKVAVIMAVGATAFLWISNLPLRALDVYNPNAEKAKKEGKKVTFRDSLNLLVHNRALLCILLAFGTDMFANQISSAVRIYFFRYNMGGRTDLISYLGYVGIVAAFILVPMSKRYIGKLGMRKGIGFVEALCIPFSLLLLIAAPRQNVVLVMTALIVNTALFSMTNTFSRSALLDAANYSEIKNGVSNNALVSSTFTFVNKCCQAFSAFFAGYILSATGYNAQLQQQSQSTMNSILYLMTLVPIAAYICSLVGMYFYPIKREDEAQMQIKMDAIRAETLRQSEEKVI